ncbi:MAG TPA: hypothetical protein VEC38_06780 [Candidatus Binataceae bacterium]|nr:hypothetical protein [Candidatus Binataceae bacterium]
MEEAAGQKRFRWRRLLLYVVAGNLILFAPAAFLEPDLWLLAYLAAVLIISLIWIGLLVKNAIARRTRRWVPTLSMLLLGWTISAVLVTNQSGIRNVVRWVVFSKYYKARVLAEAVPTEGELKHTEWDGWGWAGQDTTVYVVFDPSDSLSAAADKGQSGRFSGIPCEVSVVRRLERHWYAVELYTDELWSRCY